MMIEHHNCCFNQPNKNCLELESFFGEPLHYLHLYNNNLNDTSSDEVIDKEGPLKGYHIKQIRSDQYDPLIVLNNFIENHDKYCLRGEESILETWTRRYPEVKGRFAWGLPVFQIVNEDTDVVFHAEHRLNAVIERKRQRKLYKEPVKLAGPFVDNCDQEEPDESCTFM